MFFWRGLCGRATDWNPAASGCGFPQAVQAQGGGGWGKPQHFPIGCTGPTCPMIFLGKLGHRGGQARERTSKRAVGNRGCETLFRRSRPEVSSGDFRQDRRSWEGAAECNSAVSDRQIYSLAGPLPAPNTSGQMDLLPASARSRQTQ